MEVFIYILSRELKLRLSINPKAVARFIGSPKLQIIFHKRATKYRSLLQKMTYKDESPEGSSDLDTTLVYILKSEKYSKISKWIASARCLLPAAMLERWLHVCRVKIMFALLPNYSIVSTKTNSMKGFVKLIQVKMLVRSDHTTRCRQVQGGEDWSDPLSRRSFSTKEPLNIGHFCRKWPIKIRDPMSLRHPVRIARCSMCCNPHVGYNQ